MLPPTARTSTGRLIPAIRLMLPPRSPRKRRQNLTARAALAPLALRRLSICPSSSSSAKGALNDKVKGRLEGLDPECAFVVRKADEPSRTRFGAGMIALALSLTLAVTHPGGTDSQGCHRERATGLRHCHGGGGGAVRPPADPPRRAVPEAGRDQDVPTRAFPNCTAARAAGRTNIRRGEPGYGTHLDRDNDGIACEAR